MNAGLPDRTTTGDLVLQQAKIVPQTQHFFDFSHGQSLLGHSVSPLARGEIPIGCPAPLSAPTQKARSRNVNINSGSNPPLSSRFGLFTSRNLYSHARNPYSHPPGIFIHIAPESVFTCPGMRSEWTIVLKNYVPRKERAQGRHIRVCPRGARFWPAGTQ